jgi:predicted Zn-dependent peptidase
MLDRRIAPAFTSNFAFDLIKPEVASLPNDIPVYFVHGGDQNVLKVEIVVPAGRWNETTFGASYFSTRLLAKGTSSKTSFEIASAFDRLGAHFDANAGPDYAMITLYSLTRNLGPSLDLVTELLEDPVFPEREMVQLKSAYLQNLKVNKEKTSFLASQLFRKSLFGEHHPYGRELDTADVEVLGSNDIGSFHRQWFSPVIVLVSGKIGEDNRQKIIKSLSGLSIRRPADVHHDTMPVNPEKKHVDKAGSIQTSLRIGRKAIDRTHTDFPSFVFLNHILGGYFGSRLMKNIREDKGLTYGIHSSVHAMKRDSYVVIGTDVNKANTVLAGSEIKKELHLICHEAIPAQELETARHHFIGSLQAELSTPFAHAAKIRNSILYNLGSDHYARLIDTISRTTSKDLILKANQYFRPDTFLEVSAG